MVKNMDGSSKLIWIYILYLYAKAHSNSTNHIPSRDDVRYLETYLKQKLKTRYTQNYKTGLWTEKY